MPLAALMRSGIRDGMLRESRFCARLPLGWGVVLDRIISTWWTTFLVCGFMSTGTRLCRVHVLAHRDVCKLPWCLWVEEIRPHGSMGLMAGSAACCTPYTSCCPLVPVQVRSTSSRPQPMGVVERRLPAKSQGRNVDSVFKFNVACRVFLTLWKHPRHCNMPTLGGEKRTGTPRRAANPENWRAFSDLRKNGPVAGAQFLKTNPTGGQQPEEWQAALPFSTKSLQLQPFCF